MRKIKFKDVIVFRNEKLSLIVVITIMLGLLYLFYEINIFLMMGVIALSLVYILLAQAQQRGNSLKVTRNQYPELFMCLVECANELDIDKLPDLYISQNPYLNAFTMGFKSPYTIVLNSAVVESMKLEEIKTIIAHEMGHVKFRHSAILSVISPAGKKIPFVDFIFGFWSRKTEYTADRCALFCIKDKKIVTKTLIKIAFGSKVGAKINFDEIIEQLDKSVSGKIGYLGETLINHPYITKRIWEIIKFNNEYNLHPCKNCGIISNREADFCWACGTKLEK